MKIVDVKTIVSCPGRNFVSLKIVTEDGIYGIGDATLNGRELAVASYLDDHLKPLLIGKDASQIESMWQFLYRGAYWRRGPVTMAAIGAIDVALWDIKAKVAKMPLYELLGGKTRNGVLTYTHTSGRDIQELEASITQRVEAGYKAVRVQFGIPGLGDVYGVGNLSATNKPEDGQLPAEVWSTRKYLNTIEGIFDSVRTTFGSELELLHDAHHRLTPIEAARVGKILEPHNLFWLEDPTPAENQDNLRLIRQHTVTPIALGEIFNTIWDGQIVIRDQLIDFIRMAVSHGGGITHLKQVAAFSDVYGVRVACHGPPDISPVGICASIHLASSISNFGIQETLTHPEEAHDVFDYDFGFKDGYLSPRDIPGHGVDIDESAAAKYPYQPSYMPSAVLEDGSVWHW